jgi:hypothetical protein
VHPIDGGHGQANGSSSVRWRCANDATHADKILIHRTNHLIRRDNPLVPAVPPAVRNTFGNWPLPIFSISASDPNRNPDVPNRPRLKACPAVDSIADQRPGAGGGGADRAGDFDSHAFLYSSGMMYDLNDLVTSGLATGADLTDAEAINNHGWIVAHDGHSGTTYLLEPTESSLPKLRRRFSCSSGPSPFP